MSYYHIPSEYCKRIHFVRPRFKGDIENVLLYMAHECCKISECRNNEYREKINNAIKLFPGNSNLVEKTINNWRTEISALFGFYLEDSTSKRTRTSNIARFLDENQDLTQFMKIFLFTFQFPGGHLKPKENLELIKANIRFKPAKLILNVLLEGNKLYSKKNIHFQEMYVSAEEVAYCILNDLRVTAGHMTPETIAKVIVDNRTEKKKYYNKGDNNIFSSKGVAMTKGDVTRYAGDILDYMEIAGLLDKRHNRYYLRGNQLESIQVFVSDDSFFDGYDIFYWRNNITVSEIRSVEESWFDYVNEHLNPNLFKTDIATLWEDSDDPFSIVVQERVNYLLENPQRTTKEIGNLGESIICNHEKVRLNEAGYDNLAKLVKVVDSPQYHPGYDIDSFEGDSTNLHRYIEVKTTISQNPLSILDFHLTTNEWSVAETMEKHYYVYRLMISKKAKVLYIIQDPVNLYKQNVIKGIPAQGMDISFSKDAFETTQVLVWKK